MLTHHHFYLPEHDEMLARLQYEINSGEAAECLHTHLLAHAGKMVDGVGVVLLVFTALAKYTGNPPAPDAQLIATLYARGLVMALTKHEPEARHDAFELFDLVNKELGQKAY